jgi:hypothetical protein
MLKISLFCCCKLGWLVSFYILARRFNFAIILERSTGVDRSTVVSFQLENYEADHRIFYICKQEALMSYLQLGQEYIVIYFKLLIFGIDYFS